MSFRTLLKSGLFSQLTATLVLMVVVSSRVYAGTGGATNAYCVEFYLDRVLGNRSPTYNWEFKTSKRVQSKDLPAPPLLDDERIIEKLGINPSAQERLKGKGGPAPETAAQFLAIFPHDLKNLGEDQTALKIFDHEFLVKNYDPSKKTVLLERELLDVIPGSPMVDSQELKPGQLIRDLLRKDADVQFNSGRSAYLDIKASTPQELVTFQWKRSGYDYEGHQIFRNVPITLSKDLYFSGFKEPSSQLRAGQIIQDSLGKFYEVRSIEEHGQGALFLRRVEQLELDWDTFSGLAASPENLRVVRSAASSSAPLPSRKNGITSTLKAVFNSLTPRPAKVTLVGKGGYKLLESRMASLEDFNATKKEVSPESYFQALLNGEFPIGTKVEIKSGSDIEKYSHDGDKNWDWAKFIFKGYVPRGYVRPDYQRLEHLKISPPGDLPPIVIESDYVVEASGEINRRFFDVSPVKGIDLKYEVKGSGGPAIVHVRFPKSKNPLNNLKLRRTADELIQNLPKAQVDAQGIILLESGEYYKSGAAGIAHMREVDGQEVRQIVMMKDALTSSFARKLKVFWHETGHSIAKKLWTRDANPGVEWARATALDGKFISGYSMHRYDLKLNGASAELIEDFAETVAAYIATDGGRLQKGLRENFKNRFELLDHIFADPNALAIVKSEMRSASSVAKIAILPIGLGAAATGYYFYSTDK